MLNDLLYGFWCKHWMGITLITFIVLFFGKIIMNGIDHAAYKEKFKAECERNGGVMFVPKGVKGWPVPECMNPAAMIDIDV